MSRFWSPMVSALTPYVPGEQPQTLDVVKLNTNENPFGPSKRALEAMRSAASDSLRLYPDPNARQIREAAAHAWNLLPEQVFVGNGSDEVLAHAFFAFFQHDLPILLPDITYSFYPVYCKLYGIAWRTIPLDNHLSIPVEDFTGPNGGIVLANPNAPTGRALSLEQIECLLQKNSDSVVMIDEAYVDFGADSATALIARFPNLLIIRTLSKSYALAGLRVGFALGNAALIEGLERVKNSFNSYPLDRLAIAGATAALKDQHWFEENRSRVIALREELSTGLMQRRFEVLPSAANFVFARHPEIEAAQMASGLRERGVLVRHFNANRIDQFLRISVGTEKQQARFFAMLDKELERIDKKTA